jgi:arylsulfatase A-like enzyme
MHRVIRIVFCITCCWVLSADIAGAEQSSPATSNSTPPNPVPTPIPLSEIAAKVQSADESLRNIETSSSNDKITVTIEKHLPQLAIEIELRTTQMTKDLLPEWNTLNADDKKMFARQAEVYAAYLAYTDAEIGRVIQAVQDMGKLDNTLIIFISGDNGSSAEGTTIGTPNEVASFNGANVPVPDQLKYFYDIWGSDQTYPHMSVAWSWAFDTPFKWTKQIASHFGGTRNGMAIAWPKVIKDAGGHPDPVPSRH